MKKSILKKYASAIVKCGANVQKGQDVIIRAELDQPEFVKYVVQYCYEAGARFVKVEWSYQPLNKIHVRYKSVKTMSTFEKWELEKLEHETNTLPVLIYLESEDPDGDKGLNQKKWAQVRQNRYPILKPYIDRKENKYQWTIAAVPGAAWAKKVFPNLSKSQAMEKLWEAILYTSRISDDPIAEWKKHNDNLLQRCTYLNSLKLKNLYYKSSNGTDFRVGMLPNALFLGGGETTLGSNIYYNPNMPTEECFVTPRKGDIDGKVVSTKPLSYQGEVIEDFYIIFKDGKAVEAHAKKNEELLNKMISMDEGASMLGEVALVPVDSPISQSNILFYNTLFDENASCHLALGMGFTNCIKDYEKYTIKEMFDMGVNDSMIHVDFMIGSDDLEIVGECEDGSKVTIFKNGTWAK